MTNYPRTTRDRVFDEYVRRGENITFEQRTVLDSDGLTTTGESVTQNTTIGYLAGFTVPQSWRKAIATVVAQTGTLWGDSKPVEINDGRVIPVPTVNTTGIEGYVINEANQLSYGLGETTGTTTVVDFMTGQAMSSTWAIASGMLIASNQWRDDNEVNFNGWLQNQAGMLIARRVEREMFSGTTPVIQGVYANAGTVVQGTASGSVYYNGGSANALATAVPTPASFQAMKKAMDAAYWADCGWYMSQATLEVLEGVTLTSAADPLVKHCDNDPFGEILGIPVRVTPGAGAVSTTSSVVGGVSLINASKAFFSRESGVNLNVQTERYADYLCTGYNAYSRVGATIQDSTAIVTYKSPAS
jgi:HK97 family phage major capsid protein